ncbi:MAG TPA: nucleoside-diphosphate sugar epimerase [Novosphingobium sp.]|nr:nucleoside-diphosphate sugar epimerase [Novosphingobium sp.]
MSERVRICLVGASGLVGSALIRACVGRDDVRLVAVARRELDLPPGSRMEVLLADPANWGDAIAAARPQVLVSALGTTWAKAGRDEAAFRAVDQELVVACGRWGVEAGARGMIAISSVGADPHARALYLKVKGEVEQTLAKLGFGRLDIVRPGLLRGQRAEHRVLEGMGQLVAPLVDLMLGGNFARYRSIRADTLAEAILALAHEKARGRFVHEWPSLDRAIKRRAFQASIRQPLAVE